jgi:ubiquinol-cytochrome c reductase cytochrome b subunit
MGTTMVRLAGHQAEEGDQRFGYAFRVRDTINKVSPSHFSFLFGEIALYSFLVLVASGIYLALFYDPSHIDVTYNGAWTNLHGVSTSRSSGTRNTPSFPAGAIARRSPRKATWEATGWSPPSCCTASP